MTIHLSVMAAPSPYLGERSIGLTEFFQHQQAAFGPHLVGAFVLEKERAGELSGFESQWLTELHAFVQRPVSR